MEYNPEIYHRQLIGLKGYDYSRDGAYFITVCTHHKELYFENDEIKGIVKKEWLFTMRIRWNAILDEFVVMPNHLHGINVGAYYNTPL